ncbi:hypothetical protein WDH52_24265 [Streptomyces sp. TRM70308]|uniref:hypothetical protein n=1 Tax=Streptomyces sp. TRM70308 TaxID=3131932 RepID=UPI003D079DC4
MGIRMPDEERLQPGPRRELVVALHDLYALAGKPPARTISSWIREREDLPGMLSHEGVSAMLRGAGTPRWANLESLVRVLVEQQRVGEADVEAVVMRIHTLWRIVDSGLSQPRNTSTTPSASPEAESDEQPMSQAAAPPARTGSDSRDGEPVSRTSTQQPLIRWNPRQRTLDVFDRQIAVEIFKEVGGINDEA